MTREFSSVPSPEQGCRRAHEEQRSRRGRQSARSHARTAWLSRVHSHSDHRVRVLEGGTRALAGPFHPGLPVPPKHESAIRTQLLHKHTSTAACPHQWRGGCWGHVVAVAGALPCVRGLAPQTRSYLRVTLQHAKRREEHQYTRRRDEHHYVTALPHTPPDWSPSASRRRGSRRRACVTAPRHRVPLAHLEGVVD